MKRRGKQRGCCSCCGAAGPCRDADGQLDIEPLSSWIRLVAVVVTNVLIATPDTTFGLFYGALQEKFDSSAGAIGWVMFVYITTACLVGFLWSPVIIYYGCRPAAIVSTLAFAVGMSLTAVAPSLTWHIIFFGVLGGAGVGGMYGVAAVVVQQCFSKNRGLANGIATLGYTAGTALSPILVEFFLQEYDFSGAQLLHGAIFVQGIVFGVQLTSPKEFIKSQNLDGSARELTKRAAIKRDLKMLFSDLMDFSLMKNAPYVLATLSKCLFMIARIGVLSHMASAAKLRGIAEHDAAYLYTILGLCNLAARLACSVILNFKSVDPILVNCLGVLCAPVSALTALFASSYPMFATSMAFLGIGEGLANTVFPLVLVRIMGVKMFAKCYAVLRIMLLPVPLIAAPFTGWLRDVTGEYRVSFGVLGISGILGTCLTVAAFILVSIRDPAEKEGADSMGVSLGPSHSQNNTSLGSGHSQDHMDRSTDLSVGAEETAAEGDDNSQGDNTSSGDPSETDSLCRRPITT